MWELDFISEQDFKEHIANTIRTYDETLIGIDLRKFNSNIIDPIKLTFDSKVYNKTIEKIIEEEIVRQRDKTNTNAIGYFHQNLFRYIRNCEVPAHGFDVIFTPNNGEKIYVEMKNKHNTMNSSSSQKTYMKMQNQILNEENCSCYLVEIIATRSQNIPWSISLDGSRVSNERIRRVSVDKFYEKITGNANAFSLICKKLPEMIEEIISENERYQIQEDTVIDELRRMNPDILKSLYILAFQTYEGFEQ